jgi:cell division protein FtsN
VRVIDVSEGVPIASNTADAGSQGTEPDGTWLQAGAYGKREGAERLAGLLEQASLNPVSIHDIGDLFRVWLGPYASAAEVESVISRAIELGFDRPHRVRR